MALALAHKHYFYLKLHLWQQVNFCNFSVDINTFKFESQLLYYYIFLILLENVLIIV